MGRLVSQSQTPAVPRVGPNSVSTLVPDSIDIHTPGNSFSFDAHRDNGDVGSRKLLLLRRACLPSAMTGRDNSPSSVDHISPPFNAADHSHSKL